MALAGGSKRRVFPLQVQTLPADAPWGLLPPKSPLHGARASRQGTAAASGADGMSGFDRMLLLRNMNVSVAVTGAEERVKNGGTGQGPAPPKPQAVSAANEVSAAHNLKERKQNEARRRLEVHLMTLEDYVNTPEGDARLRRQDERARMQEEELNMQRLIQWEKAQRRAEQLKKQEEDEAKIKEMYLAKRKLALEEQERVAREKEAARKQALEAKMKALKDEADRKAREEYAARMKLLAEEAQAEQDARVAAMETAQMLVEDEIAVAMRVEWLAEMERRRQIEAEALEWKLFEEKEAERQREETQRRRDAQKQQYEQDRARRMQIHKLQQDRERAAADKKRLQEQKDQQQQQQQQVGGEAVAGVTVATSLQRLRSQCEDAPLPVPTLSLSASLQQQPDGLGRQLTARTLLTARETARVGAAGAPVLGVITEQPAFVPPPPVLPAPVEDLVKITETRDDEELTKDEEARVDGSVSEPELPTCDSDPAEAKASEKLPLEPEPVPPAETPATVDPVPADPLPVQAQTEESTSASNSISAIVDPELLSLETLREDGVTPVAEVLSVNAGSPASTAGLLPRDMIIEFGGVTIATPKCLLAIAECVQRSVNQHIALVVLRPQADEVSDVHVQRCQLWLQPRKWKGKGLLGCQLSPFKWPTSSSASASAPTSSAPDTDGDSAATDTTASSSSYDALVLHQVQPSSLAHRLGLIDGDVLARCGELDACVDVAAVAAYLQSHWREAQQEQQLTIQRWDPTVQSYAVLQLLLPVPADDEPLGCAVTTYTHYYYPETAPSTVCDECYHTTLASSLHAAALAGHVECLDALSLTCSPELLDWRDDEGRSPLFYACYAQQLEAVRCLLAHQLPHSTYDPVSGADSYGDSPLHAAAASDCVGALELLLETKFISDVNLPNASTQATAAHVAASEPTLRVLKERYNADMLMLDNDGRMPLFYACLRQDDASVAYLSELHPEFVDYADSLGGNTPLHMAAWCGYSQIVRILAKNLPSIALFAPNEEGLDARTLAERSGWYAIAEELGRLMGG